MTGISWRGMISGPKCSVPIFGLWISTAFSGVACFLAGSKFYGILGDKIKSPPVISSIPSWLALSVFILMLVILFASYNMLLDRMDRSRQ
jgi:hypothetical protein